MRRFLVLAALLTALTNLAFAQAASSPPRDAPAASAATGVIRGQVVDAASGRGLARVALTLVGEALRSQIEGATNDVGEFVLRGVPPGRYAISAQKATYDAMMMPDYQRGRRPRRLELAAGATLEGVTIAMHRSSAVTGRVVDRFGEPATNVRVSLRQFPGAEGVARRVPGNTETRTNDIGEFRLAPAPPGRYLLVAENSLMPIRPRGPIDESGWVAWPQAASIDQAQPLVLARGQDIRDIELQLFPTKTTRVVGVILGLDGAPASAARISVSPVMAGEEDGDAGGFSTMVGGDGRFELNLSPGTWDVSAGAAPVEFGVPRARDLTGFVSSRVTANGEPIDDLTLQLAAPRAISGRIVFAPSSAGAPSPDPASVQFLFFCRPSLAQAEQVTIRPDFTFSLRSAGDRCQVHANTNGWHVRSIVTGGEDVTSDLVRFGDRTSIGDLVITFSDRVTKVDATVTTAKGSPADDFLVVVFPADEARRPAARSWRRWHFVTREVGPTADGGPAHLEGLLPGEYLAIAIDPDDYEASGLPESFDALESQAQRFTLGDGESRALSLRVVRLPQ